ncbi:MAG: HsdR family type I site-specific deoxyribonuclease [Bacteroidia bacterium]
MRSLYVYSQVLLAVAATAASYGTTETREEFWANWRERHGGNNSEAQEKARRMEEEKLARLVNARLEGSVADRLYAECSAAERRRLEGPERVTSVQDRYLYWLCRPERLLDLAGNFILFEGSVKKICRYQQYFAVHKVMRRIGSVIGGKRRGGVVWHTQGSGKSLTMVLLAQHIARAVASPKIVLVTDRVELDEQITDTFGRIDRAMVQNAATGNQLVELLESPSDAVVTTVINKFEAAVNRIGNPLESADIFVLIDEGHRTQYGSFNVKMRKVLPNACFLAFTGTPLLKREKNTAKHFGGIIDSYTVIQAVEDKAVVPILYEGRHAVQDVNQAALDRGFEMAMEGSTEFETAVMRKRFSEPERLGRTEQRIHEIARDISRHYASNWGRSRTGERGYFKGMVVVPDKHSAVLYKEALDLMGRVSSEIVISAVDDREGNDDVNSGPSDKVVAYWKKMVDRYGKDAKAMEQDIRKRYAMQDDPELLIVVDKLLTGWDEPRAVVMYLCRRLKGHTLLQAIARVNRKAEGKDYGIVVDYDGVVEELWRAMQQYSTVGEYEQEDLQGTVADIKEKLSGMSDAEAALESVFMGIRNKNDVTAHLELLTDEAVRMRYYEQFNQFARLMKLAHCSVEWEERTEEAVKQRLAESLRFHTSLRNAAIHQFSDRVDYRQYERQLQKLLDQHVATNDVIRLTELVSITDKEAFEAELEKLGSAASKAETIASRTTKYVTERMEEDPSFYLRLSELIRQVIADYRARRISELEYLERMRALQEEALERGSDAVPAKLQDRPLAQTYFRELEVAFAERLGWAGDTAVALTAALVIEEIIRHHTVVDWKNNPDVAKRMVFEIGDYLLDHVQGPDGRGLGLEETDKFAELCVNIAKRRL